MADYEKTRTVYNIDPNDGIMNNLIGFLKEFILIETFNRFNPYETAMKIRDTGEFDFDDLLAFEDVTWDSVFGKLKTLEFAPVSEEEDSEGVMDMRYYLDFSDMIHDLDADSLVPAFGENGAETACNICMEIWNSFKENIINDLIENGASKERLNELLKNKMPEILQAAVKLYLKETIEDINPELGELYNKTNEVFTKIDYDDTATFKLVFASLVKGTEVIICNPDYLQLGDRIKSAAKYYISGSSVVIGQKLADKLTEDKEKFELIEKYAPGFIDYLPTMISMMVTCAVIITLDKNPVMTQIVDEFNEIPTITGNIAYYRENAEKLERFAAALANIDYEELNAQIKMYDDLAKDINDIQDPKRLNKYLLDYYKKQGKELPWGNRSLEEHWADKNSRLTFN